MTHRRTQLSKSAGVLLLFSSSLAAAQSTTGQQATAEALFEQASALVDQGRFPEACEKFAASQELDPGLGTLLYLADCYDRAGRSASAWALFREVQARSRRANQPDREQIAKERANALDGKLSRLELRVPPSRQAPGLELSVRGAVVPRASWNVAMPVDPGAVRVEARAPGKKPWSLDIVVAPGPSSRTVELPQLVAVPLPPQTQPGKSPAVDRTSGSAQRTAGFILGGVGLVGLAVGGFFGYRAYEKNKSSKNECRAESPNACSLEGASLRDDAASAAKLSTIITASGAALVVGGATLVLTAPSPVTDAQTAASHWQLELRGTW
jgi:tetratricopeptide (TPR) repeat protein